MWLFKEEHYELLTLFVRNSNMFYLFHEIKESTNSSVFFTFIVQYKLCLYNHKCVSTSTHIQKHKQGNSVNDNLVVISGSHWRRRNMP